MQLGDYSAYIIVDGKELEEYDVVHESPTTVTCWIASEEGKNFGVKWKCHKEIRTTLVRGRVIIDGIDCGHRTIRPGSFGTEDTVVKSSVSSDTAERDFMFARVQLTDDESFLDKEVPKELGEICLRLKHGKEVKCSPGQRNKARVLDGGDTKFHERAKKATVHCVGFGPERTIRSNAKVKASRKSFVPTRHPHLDLVFKYRPLAILQANGIAPRPATSDREMSINEVEIVSQNDAKYPEFKPLELNDRIQSLENELKRLRDIKSGTSEDPKPKRVKKEESEPRKRPFFPPGEIIDLT